MDDPFRNSDGRFAPGNPGGPGRPPRSVESDYLRVLAEEVPPEAWREVVRRAVKAAKRGEPKSRNWLSEYLLKRSPTLEELARGAKAPTDAENEHDDDN